MTTRKISFLGTGIAVLLAAFVVGTSMFKAQAAVTVSSGDLIRGETFSAVYYMGADGFRYVFPNDKAYFTWYTDFDSVKWVTDAQLATIQIGGNATYRPGVKMIKINTDPKTYAVSQGGVLRHVASEEVAIALYGSNWNQYIDDVPDGFFGNYTIGAAIESSSSYSPSLEEDNITTINDNLGLIAPETIDITANGYSPIDVTIEVGQTVRFTNTDDEKHSATADDLSWGSGTLNADDTFIRRFDEAGTYTFFDSYDSANTGAIYVE